MVYIWRMLIALTPQNVGAYWVEKVYGFDFRQDLNPVLNEEKSDQFFLRIRENCPDFAIVHSESGAENPDT